MADVKQIEGYWVKDASARIWIDEVSTRIGIPDDKYVRYDVTQSLTTAQKNTARTNIGACEAHSHPYLPTGGGTMSGDINMGNNTLILPINDINVSLGSAAKRFKVAYISTGHFDSIQSTALSKPAIYADSSIIPTNNNTTDLGATTHKWKNIYATTITATTFNGNLNGTASHATDADTLDGLHAYAFAEVTHKHGNITDEGTLGTANQIVVTDSNGAITTTASMPSHTHSFVDITAGTMSAALLNGGINSLSTGSSTPVDADYYISQYVGGGTSNTTYYRRPMSALWLYVKSKADNTYSSTGHTHSYLPLSGGTMSGLITSRSIAPATTETYALGAANKTFITGYIKSLNSSTINVVGTVSATGGFIETSDINKKNIIGDIDLDKAYDLIDKCSTIIYTLKDDPEQKEQIGTIALEILEFFPELVETNEDGSLMLNYSRLTIIIMKVMKDLIKRIQKLENK